MIVSVERTFIIADLPAEKELRNQYDEEHHIGYESYENDMQNEEKLNLDASKMDLI